MNTNEILFIQEYSQMIARWGIYPLCLNSTSEQREKLWHQQWPDRPVRLDNWTTMSEPMIQMSMTKQETGVGDSERPFSSPDTTLLTVCRHSVGDFLKDIGQRWRRKKRSVWDRHHAIASSCCIPHTRGNIPAALHHGGQRQAVFTACWFR